MLAILLKMALGGLNIAKTVGAALKRFFSALSLQGWVGLVVSAGLVFVALHQWGEARHWHKQSNQFAKLYTAALAHDQEIAAKALALKAKTDALTISLTKTIKDQNDATNARIDADARALSVRGPGKAAACPGHPVASALPSGTATSAVADAAGPEVSASDRAIVPWSWLVERAAEFDSLLAEVTATRTQHQQLEQAWPEGKQP